MRILIGCQELANNLNRIKGALSINPKNKIETFCVYTQSFYRCKRYDHEYPFPARHKNWLIDSAWQIFYRLNVYWFFFTALFKFDAFIYVAARTYLPLYLDFVILKLLRKTVVVMHCGSEVRYPPIHTEIEQELWGFNTKSMFLNDNQTYRFDKPFWNQRVPEILGIPIISMRNQATFQKQPFYFLQAIQEPLIHSISEIKRSKEITVIHAPSKRLVKGTDGVLRVIKKLKHDGYQFNFELIEGRPHSYVMDRLRNADILIDQRFTYMAGISTEGIAAGCCVITGIRKEYEGVSHDIPILSAHTDDELETHLRDLFEDQDFLYAKKLACYEYYKTFNSLEAGCEYFESILKGERTSRISPPKGYKKLLLKYCKGTIQRNLIRFFY